MVFDKIVKDTGDVTHSSSLLVHQQALNKVLVTLSSFEVEHLHTGGAKKLHPLKMGTLLGRATQQTGTPKDPQTKKDEKTGEKRSPKDESVAALSQNASKR